ncbi:hypothetical protein POM88_027938 [Heracleum sosnowskyi]|uniref:ClpA/ClpB AAA lid domain-containing protein n=1 Tax=Heracleum sosnowskyi TaxID=360622 RepID=A0AAD8I9X6_9APIA|nr:hypothetical protein POM88_027938 [Heracleum sosnowskyi]
MHLDSYYICAIISTLVILPTIWLRDLSLLAYISVGGILALALVVVCLLWVGVVDGVGFHPGGSALNFPNLPVTVALSLQGLLYMGVRICGYLMFEEVMPKTFVAVLAATSNQGEFEERLTKVVDEVKPALARGELKCIGATTMEEYRKYIEKDRALKRRFQVVDMPAPSVEDTVLILKGLVHKYESFHKVKYTDKAILSASSLAKQYVR